MKCPPSEAPIYQNSITGKRIDLDQLPIPRHWPLDGGRYAGTADAVITRDPDSGYLNIGTYRMMLQGKATVGLYLSPGKDARLHITRAWQQGKPIEVAAAWGIDPLFMLVGSQTFPKNVSEYEFAGGIKGQAIPVVRGKTTDLLLPANAELVIEGVIRPNSVKAEGPFGEFPGYYGRPEAGCPLVDVTAVHYRHQSDPDQRLDGRLSRRASRAASSPSFARPRSGTISTNWGSRESRASIRIPPPRAASA